MQFSRPKEADLWLSSPWYKTNLNLSSLSLTSTGERFTLRCDMKSVDMISDDKWLFTQWLQEMEKDKQTILNEQRDTNTSFSGKNKGCLEIRNINPSFNISEPLSHSHIAQAISIFNDKTSSETDTYSKKAEENIGIVLFRLPHWDSCFEPMQDITVIDGLITDKNSYDDEEEAEIKLTEMIKHGYDQLTETNSQSGGIKTHKSKNETEEDYSNTQRLLRGLNSNSHKFPWDGMNKYPRLFEAGILVLKNACVRRDGVIVRYETDTINLFDGREENDSTVTNIALTASSIEISEFHYGGCGCCPSGHGELGKTFSENEDPFIVPPHKKVIVLVQRFHHGIIYAILFLFCCYYFIIHFSMKIKLTISLSLFFPFELCHNIC